MVQEPAKEPNVLVYAFFLDVVAVVVPTEKIQQIILSKTICRGNKITPCKREMCR